MAHFEKTLQQTELYAGRVIRLTKDTVELENGHTSTREVVHHHGGACVAALTEKGEIYLVRQFRYAIGTELWELPAGKLEAGEDPFAAAKRELGEEVGITADTWFDLGPFYPTVGYDTETIYLYAARGLHPTEMHLDADEFLEPCKKPLDEVVEQILRGEIRDGKTIIGCLKLRELLARGRF